MISLVAQTVLLRRFLWHVTATEIGVGLFYASWLIWGAVGASLARSVSCRRMSSWLGKRRRGLSLLLFLPAFGLQYFLLGALRLLCGVPAYRMFPVGLLLLGSLLSNFPVGLVGGLLLPAVLRARSGDDVPEKVAPRSLAWEGVGTALAALALVSVLAMRVRRDEQRISHSELRTGPRRDRPEMSSGGFGASDWRRYFGEGRPEGCFTTYRGRYLYGESGGASYVLGNGQVSDHWPEVERAREIAALLLVQKPEARNILLLGEVPFSLALACHALLPRMTVWWCHLDPVYARQVATIAGGGTPFDWLCILPHTPQRVIGAGKICRNAPRDWPQKFDLLLCIPPTGVGPESAGWWRQDWLEAVSGLVRSRGVAAFPLAAGGSDWSELAAATAALQWRQLCRSWQTTRALPGAGGWGLATAASELPSVDRVALETRWRQLSAKAPPWTAMWQIHDPEVTEAWLQRLGRARVARQRSPEVRLNALAMAASWQLDFPALGWVRLLMNLDGWRGTVKVWSVMAWLVLPWFWCPARKSNATGVALMLAAGGALALAGSLAGMQVLQQQLGTLYLLAGPAAGLYLFGMACGNLAAVRLLHCTAAKVRLNRLPLLLALLHLAMLLCLVSVPAWAGRVGFGLAGMWLAGLPAGGYLPLAAALLSSGETSASLAARIMRADNWGGALGGLAWVVVLQPLLGMHVSVLLLAAAILSAAVMLACPGHRRSLCGGLLLAAAVAWLAAGTPGERLPTSEDAVRLHVEHGVGTSRRPRSRLEEQVQSGQLSNHEADFWEPVE